MSRQEYLKNSNNGSVFAIPNSSTKYFLELLYCLVVLAILVLIHSFYIHQRKYNLVRVVTDAFALTVIVASFTLLLSLNLPSVLLTVFGYDLIVLGLMQMVQTVLYLYLTYTRYAILYKNESKWKKWLVYFYIFFVLICTWLPFYTIVPLFVNTNTQPVLSISFFLYTCIYIPGVFFYDFYFTGTFVHALRQLQTEKVKDERLILMANKSIIHAVLGFSVDIIFIFPTLGGYCLVIYMAVHLLLFHLLFNWQAENHFPFLFGTTSPNAVVHMQQQVSESAVSIISLVKIEEVDLAMGPSFDDSSSSLSNALGNNRAGIHRRYEWNESIVSELTDPSMFVAETQSEKSEGNENVIAEEIKFNEYEYEPLENADVSHRFQTSNGTATATGVLRHCNWSAQATDMEC